MSPVHARAAAAPPPPPAPPPVTASGSAAAVNSQATAKPVKSGVDLGHPDQPLPPVAKKEDERYRQWLAQELVRLPRHEAAGILKAIDEIGKMQSCTTDAAFGDWLNQPDHKELKAVYDAYVNPVTVALKLGPAPLDPIATWLFDGHLNAKSIVAALQGQSTLGDKLQDDDKRRLLDRALANFSDVAFDKIEELAVLVRDDPKIDPKLRRLVAEQLLQRAVHPGDTAYNPRAQARAYALNFVRAMRDDPRGMAELLSQLSPPDGFGLARALGKEPLPDTRLTTSRTAGWQDDRRLDAGPEADPRLNNPKLLSDARYQILDGLQKLAGTPAARSPAITTLVYGLSNEITAADLLQLTPKLAHSLAVALADQWDPKNPPVEHLEALLKSQPGTSLLCEGSSGWKAAARKAVRANPDLTAAMLERDGGDDPKRNPKVAAAVMSQLVAAVHGGQVTVATAEENAGAELVTSALQTKSGHKLLFDERVSATDRREVLRIMLADHGQKLTRTAFERTDDAWQLPAIAGPFAAKALASVNDGDFSSLSGFGKKNLIGFWLGIPPSTAGLNFTAQDIAQAQQALARGEIPRFLTEKDFYQNNPAVEKFAGTDRLGVEHAMLFSDGPVPVPLLHGRKLDGSQFYVDQDGNVYRDSFPQDKNYRVSYRTAFQNFLDENPLPEGTLYFQGQGYKASASGHRETPAARDTSKKVLHGVARGVTTAVMIAAIVGTDGLAGVALGYAGLLGTGYLAYEGAGHLAWLDAHGHDINPFTNPDQAVLTTWLNTTADATGPFAVVGGTAARGAAAVGALSPRAAKLATTALVATAKGANSVALANAFAQMARHPEGVTAEDWLQTGFFAWMSVRAPQRPATEPARVPTSQTAKTATPAMPGPTTVTPPAPYAVGRWNVDWTPPNARPAVPPELLASQGRGGQPGEAPALAGGAPATPSSRSAASNRPKVDPDTQQMAGDKGDKPPKEPTKPSTQSSGPRIESRTKGDVGKLTARIEALDESVRQKFSSDPAKAAAYAKLINHEEFKNLAPSTRLVVLEQVARSANARSIAEVEILVQFSSFRKATPADQEQMLKFLIDVRQSDNEAYNRLARMLFEGSRRAQVQQQAKLLEQYLVKGKEPSYAEIGAAFGDVESVESKKIVEFLARIRGDDPTTATIESVLDEKGLSLSETQAGLSPEKANPDDPNILDNRRYEPSKPSPSR